ncbi:DUF6789 family protein [Mesorhizobium sp.]|uniref:DUF6789 family protein n=1 Tax=Mesorhizobium sp. TaxID=1871066 RepID=UPI000FE5A827|nr:DUF6789 family protein [Mesorhizobium sp.]RWM19460.1 MAG: hypothetical protein EOR74_31935 [Mesorhizobium sp.]RWM31209.1 MAG: hypothetical protein EOR75_30580 [Mesorhizobium sp.]TIO72966.1 MAG: hypothetical protein E5X75_30260 [Mesorhizobium sp.]TIO80988.1 MAG: hypothetical protein E5X74_30845 [Mesorhizobium sp.]TJV47957.1 MAG: hypothetical protein E5Y01_30365 [Mesorhizobium sp.]
MNTYVRSMIAGFAATLVLSLLMIMKGAMGLMPQLDVITMLSGMAQSMVGMAGAGIGWLIHFLIGTVLWGVLFALLYDRLPGSQAIAKGMSFGALAWVLMMILAMPMAGAGLFGVKLGMMAPVMTLILHLIWGAVLGFVFGRLQGEAVLST